MLKTPTANTLFYGDNLAILREHIADESVDLVYLDPPFNSNASYNVLFRAFPGAGGPTASHYLKILLDAVFGKVNIKNEIIWQRTTPKGHAFSRFASTHGVILSYDKGQIAHWNPSYF